jgi:hypothetical protein
LDVDVRPNSLEPLFNSIETYGNARPRYFRGKTGAARRNWLILRTPIEVYVFWYLGFGAV